MQINLSRRNLFFQIICLVLLDMVAQMWRSFVMEFMRSVLLRAVLNTLGRDLLEFIRKS